MKFSKDGKCMFNPDNNSYHVGNKKLIGVTTFISKYKNKFDADAVAEKFAKKNGLDKNELLKKWKLEGEQSCINGSAVHNIFERYILNREILVTGKYEKEKVAVKFIKEIFSTKRLIPVDAEIVVYNEELNVASMIDCIAKNEKDNYFILDWKTNKTIETNGYRKNMLPPFNKLPDANFYHYSLQLSLYKKMYTEHLISGIYIVHIDSNSYKIIKAEEIEIKNNCLVN